MSLLKLPPELVLSIVDFMGSQAYLSALMQVSKRFYHLLRRELCRYNIRHSQGRGICLAAKGGFLSVVKRFVRAGFNLQYKDPGSNRDHPILHAAEQGHLALVEYLLDQGSDPNFEGKHRRRTALRRAASNGFLPVVQVLFDKGGNGSQEGDDPWGVQVSISREAAFNGHTEVVEYFLSVSGRSDRDLANLCLPYAAASGKIELVSFLLRYGADISFHPRIGIFSGPCALSFAAEYGHLELVKYLLENGANARCTTGPLSSFYSPPSPLEQAVINNNASVVRLLLEHNSSLDLNGILTRSIERGNLKMVELLLPKCHLDPGQDLQFDPLKTAAKHGHIELVKLFLGQGFKSEQALIEAIKREHQEIIKLLLQAGIDPHVSCMTDGRAVQIALRAENRAIIKTLLSHGAHIHPDTLKEYRVKNLGSITALAEEFPVIAPTSGGGFDSRGPPDDMAVPPSSFLGSLRRPGEYCSDDNYSLPSLPA